MPGLKGGHSHLQGIWISQTHIFRGKPDHPPADEQRVFSGLKHSKKPVYGCLCITSSQTLMKGRNYVIVLFSVLVIGQRLDVEGLLNNRLVHMGMTFPMSIDGIVNRCFQVIQGHSGIPMGDINQMIECLGHDLNIYIP